MRTSIRCHPPVSVSKRRPIFFAPKSQHTKIHFDVMSKKQVALVFRLPRSNTLTRPPQFSEATAELHIELRHRERKIDDRHPEQFVEEIEEVNTGILATELLDECDEVSAGRIQLVPIGKDSWHRSLPSCRLHSAANY